MASQPNPPNVPPTQLRPYQPVVSLSKALLKPLFLEGVSNTYRLQATYFATLACVNTLWSNFSFGRPGGFEKLCFLSKFQRNSPSKEGVDDHSQILGFVFVDPLADMKTFCWCWWKKMWYLPYQLLQDFFQYVRGKTVLSITIGSSSPFVWGFKSLKPSPEDQTSHPSLPKSSNYLLRRCVDPLKAFSRAQGIWKTRVSMVLAQCFKTFFLPLITPCFNDLFLPAHVATFDPKHFKKKQLPPRHNGPMGKLSFNQFLSVDVLSPHQGVPRERRSLVGRGGWSKTW